MGRRRGLWGRAALREQQGGDGATWQPRLLVRFLILLKTIWLLLPGRYITDKQKKKILNTNIVNISVQEMSSNQSCKEGQVAEGVVLVPQWGIYAEPRKNPIINRHWPSDPAAIWWSPWGLWPSGPWASALPDSAWRWTTTHPPPVRYLNEENLWIT